MADKISVDQANELLGVLRTDVSVDHKVALVTAVKSGIKQHNVPDHAVPALFEALRSASSSQNAALVNAGFTALNHLLTRLSRQDPRFLVKEAARTLPLIVEKLGDPKDKYRALALQALVTLSVAAPVDVERSVRNIAMTGKNPRAKEMGMQWLLQMHREQGLPFRAYVPVLMELLEDADGMVRDAAKSTVLDLFRDAPNAAKADLKKQLKNFKVRPAIEQAIVKELAPAPSTSTNTTSTTSTTTAATTSTTSAAHITRPESRALRHQPSTSFATSVSSMSERPITPMPDSVGRPEQAEPAYVNTQRELDDIFKEMHAWFEGKETEQNWLKREESVTKLRCLLAGNAADFAEAFLADVRALLDGIIKAVISLRTSLCKEGCSLLQDIANTFGAGIDPMVEILMQALVKLSAGTKKISSQLANATVDVIIIKATYSTRILQHIWGACQDKNVQPRTYASGWLKTFLTKEMHHKERVEHSGGLEIVEKCIKKGLNDANPGVRERMRATYWFFATIWPARAELILTGLDTTAQRLLQNDPNNPNSPKRGDSGKASGAVRPGLGLSKSTVSSSKPSLREAMMAKKKEALASRELPARPGSAMAHFSPVRTVSGSSNASSSSTSTGATAGTSFGRQRAEGGLSVAPVRPTRRRPELHARPATAGPYSVRTHDNPSIEQSSPPETLRFKAAITPKTLGASPKRTVPRSRPGHQATASDSNLMKPARGAAAAAAVTPTAKSTAAASRPATGPSPRGSPSKARPVIHHSSPIMASRAATRLAAASDSPGRPLENAAVSPVFEEEAMTPASPAPLQAVDVSDVSSTALDDELGAGVVTSPALKVYEDPFSDDQPTPKPAPSLIAPTVLEDKPVNEAAGSFARVPEGSDMSVLTVADVTTPTTTDAGRLESDSVSASAVPVSAEKAKQNVRLLDSGIAKVKAQALDVHGFRKLQGIIRDASSGTGKTVGTGGGGAVLFTDERFDALLLGLFAYLESPVTNVQAEKVQDVKAQILVTIKLLLKKWRDNFQPHASRGLESLLAARADYDARTHITAGLELLADELITLGDAAEIVVVLTRGMSASMPASQPSSPSSPAQQQQQQAAHALSSPHSLSMGLYVLGALFDARPGFQPADKELAQLAGLAQRCLDSPDSRLRMDAVKLCVAMHERVGDARFWGALRGVKDDPKSLITYYIVKRQREKDQGVRA